METPYCHGTAESSLARLRSLVARLLNVEEHEIATDRPLGELGIDSLTAAELSADIEDRTGVNVPLEGFLGEQTLTEVARTLAWGIQEPSRSLAVVVR